MTSHRSGEQQSQDGELPSPLFFPVIDTAQHILLGRRVARLNGKKTPASLLVHPFSSPRLVPLPRSHDTAAAMLRRATPTIAALFFLLIPASGVLGCANPGSNACASFISAHPASCATFFQGVVTATAGLPSWGYVHTETYTLLHLYTHLDVSYKVFVTWNVGINLHSPLVRLTCSYRPLMEETGYGGVWAPG